MPSDKNFQQRFSWSTLEAFAKTWKVIDPNAVISLEPTIEQALMPARAIGNQHGGMQSLITGSLHLIGGALCLLRPDTLR